MDSEDNFGDHRGPDTPEHPPEDTSANPTSANPHDGHDLQQLLALARNPPRGASVYSPEAAVSSAVNPRSCVTCRRRKVRCDKHMPCSNCRRAKIPCIFPAPGRAPRRPRVKDPDAPPKQPSSEREQELMKRLRKLEGIVEELSGQIEVDAGRHSSTGDSPDVVAGHEADAHTGSRDGSAVESEYAGGGSPVNSAGRLARSQTADCTHPTAKPEIHKEFGRLVLNNKGVTRYVSSGFWSKLNDELDQIRRDAEQASDEESEQSDLDASPESVAPQDNFTSSHQAFILGYRSADVDLRPLHPLPSQIPFMWQMFRENVDPIVKVLHVPTMNKLIRGAQDNLDSLTPSTEALLFSIYYAAITSMNDDDVKKNFGSDKAFLVSQYRFALEQALAKANFITAPDITLLQAFILFLILVRRHDDTRFSWMLTGLITRMSHSIGLHRDGTNFPNLTPFEIEMRRRLFWQVCILDLRSAEDQGTDLTLFERTFDTQLPLNINDTDISPDSTELPHPRVGPTDMTFSLIRYEICGLARRIHVASSAMAGVCPLEAARSLEEREAMLDITYNRVEHTYLKDANIEDNPIYWVAANIARVIVAKMTLVIYQPLLFPLPSHESLDSRTRDRIFRAAIEIFEYNHLLNTDTRAKPWRWLFQTYTQWHAVAYILLEVSHRPWSATVERGWSALNSAFTAPHPMELQKMADHTAVWLPFKKMFLKAKRHRETEIARLRADPDAAQKLDFDERTKYAPGPSFGNLPGSVKSAIAHERWRKLVNAPYVSPDTVLPPLAVHKEQTRAVVDDKPATSAPAPSRATHDQVMEFVGATMSNPHTVPADFLPVIWSLTSEESDATRLGLFLPGEIPRIDTSMIDNTMTPNGDETGQSGNPKYGTQTGTGPSILSMDDNPPPWLWSSAQAPGPPQFSAQPEDLDVNMDEGFNWQGFHEDLSKFQMANGGVDGATSWTSGF